MMAKLRFITEKEPRSPRFNMAADRFLLETSAENDRVTVRFYQWQPATVSIGYMQDPAQLLDLQALVEQDLTWIRRPTGGRAVLHLQDLTYSCVFSRRLASLGESIAATNAVISRCLMAGLAGCGIDCGAHDSGLDGATLRREVSLPCFLSPNRDEIMVGGRKLIGSAQKRTATAVLQHGTIPLGPAFRSLPRYQKSSPAEREALERLLQRKCTCIAELAPTLSTAALISGLQQGFASVLGLPGQEQVWSGAERDAIAAMVDDDPLGDVF